MLPRCPSQPLNSNAALSERRHVGRRAVRDDVVRLCPAVSASSAYDGAADLEEHQIEEHQIQLGEPLIAGSRGKLCGVKAG